MKIVLFCYLPYAFAMLKPLQDEAISRGFTVLWFVPEGIIDNFPYTNSPHTTAIEHLINFKADALLVPGNEVPHFLRGIKVQISHGLAGEKSDHFRIREYFDLYLTQGPYFTDKFVALSKIHKDFEVAQTGWCKLDKLFLKDNTTQKTKAKLLSKHKARHIVLYAPTFSPSLTSTIKLLETIDRLADTDDIVVVIKFHDLMDKETIDKYIKLQNKNIVISKEKDISQLLLLADIMISDTSSVLYEFMLLDKPVVTLDNISQNILWQNLTDKSLVYKAVLDILNGDDKFSRQPIIEQYHPYTDGKSARRMIDAVVDYKHRFGVPTKRKIPWHRKLKIWKLFGTLKW